MTVAEWIKTFKTPEEQATQYELLVMIGGWDLEEKYNDQLPNQTEEIIV